MLRSGGRDMLIDKIRYLAYIVRDNKKKEQGIVNCENIKLTDLFNNQDKTLNCKSDDLLTQENEQKTKMEEYNKKLLEEINKSIEDLNKDIDKINKEKNQFEIEQER